MIDDDWPFLDVHPDDRYQIAAERVEATPFFQALGLHLDETAVDYARVSLVTGPHLVNPLGITHGGVHASLIDTAIGQALLTTIKPGYGMSTIDMDVKYFKPTTRGRLVAEGRIVRKGKRIAHGEVSLYDEERNLVAKGWCVYAIVKMNKA